MAYIGPITEEQSRFLNTFTCERLTDDPDNYDAIKAFRNKKSDPLTEELTQFAWEKDSAGSTAYYLIKNAAKEIVMYFSLQCGVLLNTKNLAYFERRDFRGMWGQLLTKEEAARPELQRIIRLDPIRVLLAQTSRDFDNFMYLSDIIGQSRIETAMRSVIGVMKYAKNYNDELVLESNENLVRVSGKYSAIELVHLCKNTIPSKCWDPKAMGNRTLAEAMFWFFIVPKMLEINKLVGSEYVFLFAADFSMSDKKDNGTLIDFYRGLHFDYSHNLGTVKPAYDFGCPFMYQQMKAVDITPGLEEYRQNFFENFNIPPKPKTTEDPSAPDFA